MTERWRLERAGIINVFQYGDETLHFGGGRLLLRGVNGSGKSTAMNMLLPFLLDADVRRIDAAGEQTGVLRSWMLSGREETQPTGYLWLEMTRGEEHLAFGCGIRANRNTDTVNHWWFVTDRRPGIDLALVRRGTGGGRVPLSAEQLRTEIGAESVWARDQRGGYREALRSRLYGGADIDQHLRLLHIVRNPRVGDRVDVDLPNHLHDALPRLSEASIDDAATPLEQLEEHRRNVAQLTGTVRTLDALVATYRLHARSELRTRAKAADELVRDHRRLEGRMREASRAHAEARAEAVRITNEIARWSAEVDRHQGEIEALRKRPAYQNAIQLEDKQTEVERLRADAVEAEEDLARVADEREGAAREVAEAERATTAAGDAFDEAVAVLRDTIGKGLIDVDPPSRPDVPSVGADGGERVGDDADADAFPDEVLVPLGPLDETEARARLGGVRAAAQGRSDEIAELEAALDDVDRAADALETAEDHRARTQAALDDLRRRESGAQERLVQVVDTFLRSIGDWDEQVTAHVRATAHLAASESRLQLLPHGPRPNDPVEVAESADGLVAERRRLIEHIGSVHVHRIASIESRLEGQRLVAAEARASVEELASRTLPDPPSVPWQGDRAGPSLAELVDFRTDFSPADQRGIEAALEAAGLLAAEVRAEGLVADDGELIARPGVPVDRPLADLLRPVRTDGSTDAAGLLPVLAEVLRSVSVDPNDLDRVDGPLAVVTTDGRFRIGTLTGRHAKEMAEHIGVTARRAALERQRAEAARIAAEADAAVERSETELGLVESARTTAEQLADGLPRTTDITKANTALDLARAAVEQAALDLDEAIDAVTAADGVHAQRVDLLRRRSAELALPRDRTALQDAAEACRLIPAQADGVSTALGVVSASVDRWSREGRRWVDAVGSWRHAARRRDRCDRRHRTAFAELATLEDQVGLDASQVVAAITEAESSHSRAIEESDALKRTEGPANQQVGTTRATAEQLTEQLEQSETACRTVLARLREAVRVPGLLEAALEPSEPSGPSGSSAPSEPTGPSVEPGPSSPPGRPVEAEPSERSEEADPVGRPVERLPVVPESSTGLRTYARALLDQVPEAPPTPADNVRIALRQRRADLGAGWDARDFQPDPTLPLAVEVDGPLGSMSLAAASVRSSIELRTASALLSAQQDGALRNLLQGLIADEVATKMHAAQELVDAMNARLESVRTTHGVGVGLRWRRRDDLSPETTALVDLLRERPGLRHDPDAEARLVETLSVRIDEARRDEPEAPYSALIARIFDYRDWHQMVVMVHRAQSSPERLKRGTALSEGEKKMVSYQPLFAAVAASCDSLAETAPDAPRFVLLDDAFAKVSEDNHPKLFGLLVELDLDFIATSERLWGTHDTVPELAITEVLRDADAGVIVLEHSHWDGRLLSEPT